jgi:hypothetical protein
LISSFQTTTVLQSTMTSCLDSQSIHPTLKVAVFDMDCTLTVPNFDFAKTLLGLQPGRQEGYVG